MINAKRWQTIKMIVSSALELPPADRAAFLHTACGSDGALRVEVDSLLEAAEGDTSFPAARDAVAAAARSHVSGLESDGRAILETALSHQYDILGTLGRGAMGAVYLARERALERLVAIKMLRPDLAAAVESRERFRREARIIAQLSHPGILPLHTFGEVDGIWYFVMGYVRGASLAERLRLEGRLPWATAHHILYELADALECAHRHGVVHRDIKPANVLLDEETGRAVLADFGISKVRGMTDSVTDTGVVMGTPHYMSPEQALGASDVDERSDIYSLGAMAYAMLAGQVPFAGGTPEKQIRRRLVQDPAPLKEVAPSVPDGLAEVVMRCLARERELRWPDARALRQALARAGGDPALALPDELRDLPSFGAYAILWGVAWSALGLVVPRHAVDRALLIFVASLVPFGLLLHVWISGRNGLGMLDIARIACWPPEWWGMWWPRALRRPSDLWARLPWRARFFRVAMSVFTIGLPLSILTRHWLEARGRLGFDGARRALLLGADQLLFAGSAVTLVAAIVWAVRQGLNRTQVVRILFGATSASAAWKSPALSRLLRPATGRVRPPERDVPADHWRAIGDLIPLLPLELADAGLEASRIAHQLVGVIERCDEELASLERDASMSEIDRLGAQLAGLEAPAPSSNGERVELRDVVHRQLDLMRRMRGRHELLSRQRVHRLELLRGLWTQLCMTCDEHDVRMAAATEPAGRVQALCAEIAAELDTAPAGQLSKSLRTRAPVQPQELPH